MDYFDHFMDKDPALRAHTSLSFSVMLWFCTVQLLTTHLKTVGLGGLASSQMASISMEYLANQSRNKESKGPFFIGHRGSKRHCPEED